MKIFFRRLSVLLPFVFLLIVVVAQYQRYDNKYFRGVVVAQEVGAVGEKSDSRSFWAQNFFTFVQVKYEGNWDPYPDVWPEIMNFLITTTSVEALPSRIVVDGISEEIFNYPVMWILGRDDFGGFKLTERNLLRQYLERGGMIFIDDSSDSGDGYSLFRRKIMEEFARIFPYKKWEKIPESDAIFKSFYLMAREGIRTSGRVIRRDYLEGIKFGSRYAVIYSPNDLLGAWQKDRFGNYLYPCVPYGEGQRYNSHKLVINFILYSLTGTYKSDAVHQPFIDRKIGR